MSQQWVPVNGQHPHSRFADQIRKSQQDDRDYRLIKLENGLEALLVSDATTDKAAASLNVGVGHLSDPIDMPGLAHFCEHLSFMGTEQFPRENAYSEYISAHGGHSNAYTSTNNTNYHFNITATALSGALDRFSTFFHSPLFTPSCTTRELKAVDSEHKKNKQNDVWRGFQLDKSLSKEGARWAKFGSGCWESLIGGGKASLMHVKNEAVSGTATPKDGEVDDEGGEAGRETRRRLLEWWENEYCASRMKLVVVGKESLDELTAMVAPLFAPIKNRQLPIAAPPTFDSPWGPEQEGSIMCQKTVMDFKAVGIKWIIPHQATLYRHKPAEFINHFIAHEGPGSVHSYLKRRGWIVHLSAGSSTGDEQADFDFVRVSIVLTTEGWENYTSVVQAVHTYLDILRNTPPSAVHQEEIKIMGEIGFRFKEKGDPDSYATRVSEAMLKPYAKEDILSGAYLISEWHESEITNILKYFTPSKARINLMSRDGWDKIDLLRNATDQSWLAEKWYGTEYKTMPYDPKNAGNGLESIKEGELFLPGPNEFIPRDLEVEKKDVSEPLKRPLKIRETGLSTLWYKKDDRFWVPKATVVLDIRSPLSNATPLNGLKTRLFGDLVQDALTETTYDASIAGLSYNFQNTADGVSLSLGGYNDKIPVLLKVLLEKVKGIKVDKERLGVLKEQLKLEYENFYLDQPYQLSDHEARSLLWERVWSPREKLAELEFVTAESVQAHIIDVLSRVHIKALVHGNVLKADAIKIVTVAEEVFGARPLTPQEKISMRSLILPEGCNFVLEKSTPNKNDVNSSLSYYLQIGDILDPTLRPTLSLFAQIASEPCFDQLRTKEQLGYIVSSGQWSLTGAMGLRIVVQSERDPAYLESRVEVFLGYLRGLIEEMDGGEFEKQRKGLIDNKLAKIKNLGEEASRFWSQIDAGYDDFLRREIDAAALEKITREDILAFFDKYIHPSSPTRSKLSVHLRSQAIHPPKFSITASKVFLAALKRKNVTVEEEGYHKLSASEPPVTSVSGFWKNHLEGLEGFDKTLIPEMVELVEKIAKEYPAAGQEPVKLSDKVVFIEDGAAFKAGLTLSKAATPVVDLSDLAVSKL